MQLTFLKAKGYMIFSVIAITVYLFILMASQIPKHIEIKYYEIVDIPKSSICEQISKLIRVQTNTQCGRFPMLADLNVSDTNWQVKNTINGTFYLFNAYFDDREALKNNSVIRILALVNKVEVSLKAYCQFWFDGMDEPIPVQVQDYLLTWNKLWCNNTKGVNPYLINCPNPLSNLSLVPQFVSFVEHECENANNILEIRNKRPKNGHKENFLVSVKCLDFQNDISLLLVEWCEILKIFGVNKVEIFIVNAHPNVIRVLKMYQAENFVTIKYFKYPHEFPHNQNENFDQFLQNDLVPYHDSFYENLYLYEYMIPMDVDEFIIPRHAEDRKWSDLLTRLMEKIKPKNEIIDAFPAMNMYFLLKSVHENVTIPGISKNLRFLSNIYRAANFTPYYGGAKSFMRMDRVEVLHNHFPQKCLDTNQCKWHVIPPDIGQNIHYRTDCPNLECQESLQNPITDTTLWKYKDNILRNVNSTIQKLKEFQSDLDNNPLDIIVN